MSITLYYHPLSSYCQKAIIGLYELDVPFAKRIVDLGDPADRAGFLAIAPLGKFPVIVDHGDGDRAIPESTILLEHVDPAGRLFPSLAARAGDRFWDLYVHHPMQTIVGDRLRPASARDPFGVAQARARIEAAFDLAEAALRDHRWAAGDDFTIADCAAAPALFFTQRLVPFGARPQLAAYDARLRTRASVARTFDEAAPYLAMFPG